MAICRCRFSLLPDSRRLCQSHWTPTSSHTHSAIACNRRWLECFNLSMPPSRPTACAGPACEQHACILQPRLTHSMNPWASSQPSVTTSKPKTEDGERVCEVEHGVWPPLCCPQLEVLAVKPPLSINARQISSAPNNRSTILQCNQLAKMSPLSCHPTICNYVCQGVVHLTTARGVRWVSPSPHLKDSQCNSIVTKTLSLRVLFLLFRCLTSFLYIFFLLQYSEHCITQFTLYTGINVWPRQAWLTVLVYRCVFFIVLWSHIDLLSSQYWSVIWSTNTTHSRLPQTCPAVSSYL